MDHHEPTESGDNAGSVWTSYSDLFMAIAVVFLVMFVFSMLAVGIGQFRSQVMVEEAKTYQIGDVPTQVLEQNAKDQSQIQKTVQQIEQQHASLTKNLEALQDLAKQLQSQEDLLVRMQQEQLEKNAMLSKANERIKSQDVEISALQLERKQLADDIVKAAMDREKLKAELEELQSKDGQNNDEIADLTKQISDLQNDVNSRSEQISNLEKKIAKMKAKGEQDQKQLQQNKETILAQEDSLNSNKQMIDNLSQDLSRETKKTKGLSKDLQTEQDKNEKLSAIAASQKAKMGDQSKKLDDQGKEIASLNGKVSGLEGDKAALTSKLDATKQKAGMAEDQAQGLGEELTGKKKALKDAMDKLAAAHQAGAGKDAQLADAKNKLAEKDEALGYLKGQNDKLNKLLGDASKDIASKEKALDDLTHERERIGKKLADGLKKAGADVDVDPKSGIVTLRMDEALYFDNASFVLKDAGKKRIQQFIPEYAKTLFSDPSVRERIAAVTVTGHASPRYRRVFVDPFSDDDEAYTYNLVLSVNRAKAVTEHFFAENMGSYSHRNDLKKVTAASGMSYMDPVIAKTEDIKEPCGTYDCALSRRVEINFLLKGRKPAAAIAH